MDTKIPKEESAIIPSDAHSFEVFAIKDCEESPTKKQAFIGFKLANGNFHFIGVPFTEPETKILNNCLDEYRIRVELRPDGHRLYFPEVKKYRGRTVYHDWVNTRMPMEMRWYKTQSEAEGHIDTLTGADKGYTIETISYPKKLKKGELKPEHQKIINTITKYLEDYPEIRFGQALFNLNINEFANKDNPERENHRLRDIHSDSDKKIIERLPK